jgi:hypothetical protein
MVHRDEPSTCRPADLRARGAPLQIHNGFAMQFNMLLLPNKGGTGSMEYFPPERATQDLTSTYVMPDEGQMKRKEGEREGEGACFFLGAGDASKTKNLKSKTSTTTMTKTKKPPTPTPT